MHPKKLQVKFFTKSTDVNLEKLIPVFHEWIREKKIDDELLIDVADYSHVPQGPGIALIGHQSDYYLDMADDKPGLLYSRKRLGPDSLEAGVEDAISRALNACTLLESESELGLEFDTRTFELVAMDRLAAANTDETFSKITPALEAATTKLFGKAATAERMGESNGPFSIRVTNA